VSSCSALLISTILPAGVRTEEDYSSSIASLSPSIESNPYVFIFIRPAAWPGYFWMWLSLMTRGSPSRFAFTSLPFWFESEVGLNFRSVVLDAYIFSSFSRLSTLLHPAERRTRSSPYPFLVITSPRPRSSSYLKINPLRTLDLSAFSWLSLPYPFLSLFLFLSYPFIRDKQKRSRSLDIIIDSFFATLIARIW